MTIDFTRRIFATGMGEPRFAAIANIEIMGQGWQRSLVNAAEKHLNDVMN